ncbi:hypothetical protein F1D05_24995 [Kribbella qitaiheensis]|uniref:Uncharacterized protein n=2 Tax=Kribbella qitaiheensis TaxID=1544730 RepID=A0A7G6X2V7_9ACTN|nr:hypothetical protein F1D05_24995 [Kribbella qitaiheensis]
MSQQEQADVDMLYRGGQVSPTRATGQQREPATAGRGGQTAGQQHQKSMDRGGHSNGTAGQAPGGD